MEMSMSTTQVQSEVEAAPILEVRGLTKHFPTGESFGPWRHKRTIHAVDDVSFSLRRGRITALVGESGSGKSTVARLLAQLYTPTAGQILLEGDNVLRKRSRRQRLQYRSRVQMIFQDPFASLNPVKRVEHHIARPLKIHHIVPGHQVPARVRELLTTVGLVPAEDFARKFPHQLSGGQRQRVAIARALAVEPDVLLADEPISMLDVSIRIGILNLMLHLKDQRGLAFLYITHDIASARYVADEVLVLYAGHIVEQGETDAVLQNPLHPYTQLLISAVPNPGARLTVQRIEVHGDVPIVIDPKPGCRFASRCPFVMDRCRDNTPQLAEIERGHWVRCYLYPGS
jgi:peptide/nickel transport system ATP-binding protein